MSKKKLNQELFDEPYKFEFFQAVRLLEKIFPERAAVSRSVLPENEVVQISKQCLAEISAEPNF